MNAAQSMALGVAPFRFGDLFDAAALARLEATFAAELAKGAPEVALKLNAWRGGRELAPLEESELLLAVGRSLELFLARLFRIKDELVALRRRHAHEQALCRFRHEFIDKRVRRRRKDALCAPLAPDVYAKLDGALGAGEAGSPGDEEARAARVALGVLGWWQLVDRRPAASRAELAHARAEVALALGTEVPESELKDVVSALLGGLEGWHAAKLDVAPWPSYRRRLPIDPTHERLLELAPPAEEAEGANEEGKTAPLQGRREALRARSGFALTDPRMGPRAVHREVADCLLCHVRQKDSCRTGLKDSAGTPKVSPLGTTLGGCPLDERISEVHTLFAEGRLLAALAMVTRDNPMCPGTGHRICNDCMKSCILQKHEPINVPEVETHVLTEVLGLPYGFELWSLLTRFNPLRRAGSVPTPYRDRKALVVGLGPAGYTLAHYLLMAGFGVVAIEGLKLEPLDERLVGTTDRPPEPIRDAKTLLSPLNERVPLGFGGVAEYGITVRWDKNFLHLLALNLARWRTFAAFGGVRFGGTCTLDDAWAHGFDHVALAAGAGRPTLVQLENNLMRGMRAASDFLMGLQLSGAFRTDSMANLQVELPAVVIGGGLTAFDTATELAAYYPVQVAKLAARIDVLGRAKVLAGLDEEEKQTLARMLAHADELAVAEREGGPTRAELVRRWGGVTVAYRRELTQSPAYRLNHEEVQKALEEGIYVRERTLPIAAVPDAYGHVAGLRVRSAEGAESVLPARAVIMAAGTAPNVAYAREHPGTLPLDGHGRFLLPHHFVTEAHGGSGSLVPSNEARPKDAFFAGARGPARAAGEPARLVSFLGDNHPTYVGNVVRAMASAKAALPAIEALFAQEQRTAPTERFAAFCAPLRDAWQARVVKVVRLTPTIVEVVVRAPAAVARFAAGQFFRLQNFERDAGRLGDAALSMEGLALTGAWVDQEAGTMGLVALELGVSSRLCALLRPGQEVVVMGPTGTATHIPRGENVLLCGGGLGNAVLFGVAKALQAAGNRVLYFAAYRRAEDIYKQSEVEANSDEVVWSLDAAPGLPARRACDKSFVGNVVEALTAHAEGRLGPTAMPLSSIDRIITIGSDRMMAAIAHARQTTLKAHLSPHHVALASINSPMQCMLKEICAQCLQRHVDPKTGRESFVFSCFNQDQPQDSLDWQNLQARLRQNTLLEKVAGMYYERIAVAELAS